MSTGWTVEVGTDLRKLFWRTRKDKRRWPPKGLTQQQVAEKIGKSQVWYRQIENGYAQVAALDTIADICEFLDIDALTLDALGYNDVAEEVRVRGETAGHEARVTEETYQEDNMMIAVPVRDIEHKLSRDERRAFAIILRKLGGRDEPLGNEVWRR